MVHLQTIVKRGELIESIHKIKCLIKDSSSKILLSTDNDQDLVFPRSSIKIFQALPFILSGAEKKFNLDEKMLAIACASHCGEPQHLNVLCNWIKKICIPVDDLKCGIHNPINNKSFNDLLLSGNLPNQLHNNCAGKHLGMISGCMAYKMSHEDYINLQHPYQKLIRDALEYFMGTSIQKKNIGVDGCSAPQYAFSLSNLANSMIRLFDRGQKRNDYFLATKTLICAIKNNPELIGGKNRFDSEIIKHTNGRIFCKAGAEGVLLFSDSKKQIGGIIKITDGNERAVPSAAIKIFYDLGLINNEEKIYLNKWLKQIIYNHANNKIGEIFSEMQ